MENEQTNQDSKKINRKLLLLLLIAICGIVVLAIYAVLVFIFNGMNKQNVNENDFEMVIRELKTSGLATGSHPTIALPASLRHMSYNGTVSAVVTNDGRLIVLFKTSVGWKGNYDGFVYSDAPLKTSELSTDYYGRPIIAIDGLEGDCPVIHKQINSRWFEVFFDLG